MPFKATAKPFAVKAPVSNKVFKSALDAANSLILLELIAPFSSIKSPSDSFNYSALSEVIK